MTRMILATALTATLLVGTAQAVPDESGGAPAAGSATAIAWGPCKDKSLQFRKAQCGFVAVPLDYAVPGGPQVRIAVSRTPGLAPRSERRGVLLWNPGGPGSPGLNPEQTPANYDTIGFDPRGTGLSRPRVRCDPPKKLRGADPGYAPMGGPDSPVDAGERKWLRQARQLAQSCAKSGPILEHLTTAEVARDMDSIRVALGVEKISYFGNSYGTYLGQVYASMFPERVDRMVLDSVVPPTGIWYDFQLEQAAGNELATRQFWKWIARRADRYQLGASGPAVQRWVLRQQQQQVRRPTAGVGPRGWADLLLVGSGEHLWKRTAAALSAWKSGDPAPVRALLREFQLGGRAEPDVTRYYPVTCTDGPWPRDYATVRRDAFALAERAPVGAWWATRFNLPCLYWPAPSRTAPVIDGSLVPPILLLNSQYDGATPLSGALAARDAFPRAALLLLANSAAHGVARESNRCVFMHLQRYLEDGILPARKPGRTTDLTCRS